MNQAGIHARPQSGIRELLLLPVLMGGLSLLMWFSLPTRQEARDAHAQEIELRRDWYVAVAQDLPANGRATSSSCSLKLDPSPSRYRYDNSPDEYRDRACVRS